MANITQASKDAFWTGQTVTEENDPSRQYNSRDYESATRSRNRKPESEARAIFNPYRRESDDQEPVAWLKRKGGKVSADAMMLFLKLCKGAPIELPRKRRKKLSSAEGAIIHRLHGKGTTNVNIAARLGAQPSSVGRYLRLHPMPPLLRPLPQPVTLVEPDPAPKQPSRKEQRDAAYAKVRELLATRLTYGEIAARVPGVTNSGIKDFARLHGLGHGKPLVEPVHSWAKAEVEELRDMWRPRIGLSTLAKHFGVKVSHIRHALKYYKLRDMGKEPAIHVSENPRSHLPVPPTVFKSANSDIRDKLLSAMAMTLEALIEHTAVLPGTDVKTALELGSCQGTLRVLREQVGAH